MYRLEITTADQYEKIIFNDCYNTWNELKDDIDFFKKLKLDEKTLMNSIISSVGAETSPKTVKNLGTYSRNLYLTKRTQQDLQESLEAMINCTKEDLQELENIYKESLKDETVIEMLYEEIVK